jgi:predicted pyridoxine 5'-phosphate oxidase superfamily flavin-nucleotide-binding protein
MMQPDSPFHAGERSVQRRAGMDARIEQIGRRIIRDQMPDEHRELFAALPFLVLGTLDARQRPWASLVAGSPGFAHSPDPRTLRVDATLLSGDPLRENVADGAPVGVLGIELATRRRNRMNGWFADVDADGFAICVGQSFGNCPQYIQARRVLARTTDATPVTAQREGALLGERALRLVAGADTFFIATASSDARSGSAREGVDVSHRGGRPGFVRADVRDGHSVLTAPDFRGNFLFQTLGNLAVNPRAGITFVDFATGDLLLLTGAAETIWDGAELASFAGAERLLRFRVDAGIQLANALPLRWSAPAFARQLDATGTWDEAAIVAK